MRTAVHSIPPFFNIALLYLYTKPNESPGSIAFDNVTMLV